MQPRHLDPKRPAWRSARPANNRVTSLLALFEQLYELAA